MNPEPLRIVILGLSITSSWGNGHATTYRALVRELGERGHKIDFLERDVEWYAGNRDLPDPPWCSTTLYDSVDELRSRFSPIVRDADVVIVGSYVPDGIEVGRWVLETARGLCAFYDIDTPVTLAALERGDCAYQSTELIPHYDLYLSFSGGPALEILEQRYGSPCARPLYCSVDSRLYHPTETEPRYDLGYMGTYSVDRQPGVEQLLIEPARRWPEGCFILAGPQYPDTDSFPPNLEHIAHLPPEGHCAFYNSMRYTLNITRADMIRLGYAPSVRLFEAAACGTAIVSDYWSGLETFFEPGREILLCDSTDHMLELLRELDPATARELGQQARRRVMSAHTAAHRAAELERTLMELLESRAGHRRYAFPG